MGCDDPKLIAGYYGTLLNKHHKFSAPARASVEKRARSLLRSKPRKIRELFEALKNDKRLRALAPVLEQELAAAAEKEISQGRKNGWLIIYEPFKGEALAGLIQDTLWRMTERKEISWDLRWRLHLNSRKSGK